MLEWLDSALTSVGFYAYVVLLLAALLEYVFPPVPGDTLILLGGVYAVRGRQPMLLVFLAVVTGSVIGAALAFSFGIWLRKRMAARPHQKHHFGITSERLALIDRQMQRFGGWLLLFNRFLPGVRSLVFIAAGASGLPAGKTLALGALAAALHTGVMLAAGWAVGGNLELLARWMERSQWAIAGLVGVAVLALVVRSLAGRRRAAPEE